MRIEVVERFEWWCLRRTHSQGQDDKGVAFSWLGLGSVRRQACVYQDYSHCHGRDIGNSSLLLDFFPTNCLCYIFYVYISFYW